jgi:glucosylglycerate synthase
MATANLTADPALSTAPVTAPLLVSLPRESFDQTLQNLAAAFPSDSLIVATPDVSTTSTSGPLQIIGYTPAAPSTTGWTLVAADFLNAHELAQKHEAKAILLLGAEAHSLSSDALVSLASEPLHHGKDLAVPRYSLPARAGLVNSAILYPISRALFGAAPRFPLALDLAFSARMAERLAIAAQRFTAANQPDAFLWPVAEAAVAGFAIAQVDAGPRTIPQPAGQDLNSVLASVAGSLFADVDTKAAFWQRSRVAPKFPGAPSPAVPPSELGSEDIKPMLDGFRLAYTNLHEIWSLVLPPQSLFGLKRLAEMPPASFVMQDSLWARIVYDFLLAFRLRTINRGHLLGALTPLYLAWVASHILQTSTGTDPERHIEAVATAFEADKPYLVSRWRWPDRFNP